MNSLMRCPACGNLTESHRSIKIYNPNFKSAVEYTKCEICKSYFTNINNYTKTYEETLPHKYYAKVSTGLILENYKTLLYKHIIDICLNTIPPPASLLDIGCGFGGLLFTAKTNNYNVSGVDINPIGIDYAKNKGYKVYLDNPVNFLTNTEEKFEIITCLDTNCYFEDQKSVLMSAYNKLSRGGILVLRYNDHRWLFDIGLMVRKINLKIGNKIILPAIRDFRFTMKPAELIKLMENIGFKILRVSTNKIHSSEAPWFIKLNYIIGGILWKLFRIYCTTGVIIVGKKPIG